MKRKPTVILRPVSQPNSAINVTPLVDVVLVMLIIFMVVTPLLDKDIQVRVPKTEQVDDPQEIPPDQLVVHVGKHGDLSLNNEKLSGGDYVERLRPLLARRRAGDKIVFFVADDEANYARLVAALDGAKLAGAETLGMAVEPPPAP